MDRHPVRRLIDIEGSSLQEVWGPGPWGEGALRAFVEAVRDANAELIGLPPAAGWLKQRGVTIAGRHVLVDYEQRQDGTGAEAPALDAQQIFVFDLTGGLIWIENDTILPAWVTPNRRLRER